MGGFKFIKDGCQFKVQGLCKVSLRAILERSNQLVHSLVHSGGDSCLHLVVHIYMSQKMQRKSPQKPPQYPHNAGREAKSLETMLQKVAEFAAISSIMLISPNLVQ